MRSGPRPRKVLRPTPRSGMGLLTAFASLFGRPVGKNEAKRRAIELTPAHIDGIRAARDRRRQKARLAKEIDRICAILRAHNRGRPRHDHLPVSAAKVRKLVMTQGRTSIVQAERHATAQRILDVVDHHDARQKARAT